MLKLLSFIFTLLCSPLAWAQLPVLNLDEQHASYPLSGYLTALEDVGKTLGVADLARPDIAARFAPRHKQGEINFGYSQSAYWLRLNVRNNVRNNVHDRAASLWFLEVAYPSLDHLDVYFSDAQGRLHHLRAGDKAAFSTRPYPHRNFVFPVNLPAGESLLYLRAESSGSLTLPAELWRPDAFHRMNPGNYSVLALYYGTLLALGGYNLLLYLSLRDRAYLHYVLFVVGMAVGQASLNGVGNQFVWPDFPAWGNIALPVGFAFAGLFGSLFSRTFLETATLAPRLDKALQAGAWLFLAAMAAQLISYRAGAMLTSLGGLLVSNVALLSGVVSWRRGHAGARFFLLAWALLLVGVGIMALRNFGWAPTNFFTYYAMQIGSTLDLLLLSFALADRINTLRAEKESVQAEALSTKQALVESLTRSEQELEARVEARTRELEAANARLRENEKALTHIARLDPLTGLGNRIVLDEELNRATHRAARHQTAVAVLLVDLDDFKPVNDQYGHATGDLVLREVARRFQECVRRTETVIRHGGDEFVIIVEGTDAARDAHAVARKLLERMAEPIETPIAAVQVGASIGIALYPSDGQTPGQLIHEADQAMYAAKTGGRGRFCWAAEACPAPLTLTTH